jgi:hypothetical protein
MGGWHLVSRPAFLRQTMSLFRTYLGLLAALVLTLGAKPGWTAPSRPADLVLTGTLTGADHQTYKEVPFLLPANTKRLTVEFDYTGREDRTTIDLGLYDPGRFRGWSGGNKREFTLAASDATPSYLAGPLPTGEWKLLLGIPNIRPTSQSSFTAKFWFDGQEARFDGFAAKDLATGPRWYRGDLHAHTGHSDGSCLSRKNVKSPCPVYRSLEAAARSGLDFVAITDHNASSHVQSLRELQPYFDDLLLIPGREITTFQGHANVFGLVDPINFQLTSPRAPSMATILDQAHGLGGLVAINHPALPSGEQCMGCGWTAQTPWDQIDAIEVINGGTVRAAAGVAETPFSGIAFWQGLLDKGYRLTAIAGSDNHDPDLPSHEPGAIGNPTTLVYAAANSQVGILGGIRAGKVLIDLDGVTDRDLTFYAEYGTQTASMGEVLALPNGGMVRFLVQTRNLSGTQIEVIGAGDSAPALSPITKSQEARWFTLKLDRQRRWIRLNIRAANGRLLMISNPIYFNFTAKPPHP